jgi:hypothetical protein
MDFPVRFLADPSSYLKLQDAKRVGSDPKEIFQLELMVLNLAQSKYILKRH